MKAPERAAAVVMVGALSIALVAGCGASSPDGAADGGKTVTLWELVNPEADDVRGKDLAKNIQSFEDAHPGVTVEVKTLPWANIDPQLMQAASAGNSPDVVRLLAWDLPKHVAAGNLLPLDDYFADDQDDWLLGWDTLTADGTKWAIPYEYRSPALYYRSDFTGEKAPATWEEMLDQGAADAQRPDVVLGLSSGSQASALAEVFVSYLWEEGGEVFEDDGSAAFDSPEGIRAFERLGSLVGSGAAPSEVVGYTYEEVFQSITAGASDFWLLGSHRYETALAAAGLEGKLHLAPLPGDGEQPAPAHVFGWTLAMGKDADQPDLAAELIKHLTSAEAQLDRVKATGELPTRASVYEDAWFDSEEAATARMLADWFASSGRTPDYGEHWVELSQIWAEELQRMALEGTSAEDAATNAATAYDELR